MLFRLSILSIAIFIMLLPLCFAFWHFDFFFPFKILKEVLWKCNLLNFSTHWLLLNMANKTQGEEFKILFFQTSSKSTKERLKDHTDHRRKRNLLSKRQKKQGFLSRYYKLFSLGSYKLPFGKGRGILMYMKKCAINQGGVASK